MPALKLGIIIVEVIVGAVVVALLGDYSGYKLGHWRFAGYLGILTLVSVVAFAIYAAVMLA